MELTVEQASELKRTHRRTKDRNRADRIKAVLMLGDGFSCEQVGRALLLDDDTVRGYRETYTAQGLEGLLSDGRKGSSPRLDEDQLAQLDAHLSERVYSGTAGVVQWVYENFGVRYSRTGITDLLHRMGYVYKRPKRMPPKGDAQRQREFVERYREITAGMGPQDTLLFMDGVHPLHNSVAAHGWFKRGRPAQLPSNTGRRRVSINGALDLRGRRVSVLECERINAQVVIDHLKVLLSIHTRGRLYIVLDNARYYRAKVVRDFLEENPRVELVFLPPYSPNLNIIERLWLVMKREVVFNRYYQEFKDFRKAILDFFDKKAWDKPCHANVLTDNFQIIETKFSGFNLA